MVRPQSCWVRYPRLVGGGQAALRSNPSTPGAWCSGDGRMINAVWQAVLLHSSGPSSCMLRCAADSAQAVAAAKPPIASSEGGAAQPGPGTVLCTPEERAGAPHFEPQRLLGQSDRRQRARIAPPGPSAAHRRQRQGGTMLQRRLGGLLQRAGELRRGLSASAAAAVAEPSPAPAPPGQHQVGRAGQGWAGQGWCGLGLGGACQSWAGTGSRWSKPCRRPAGPTHSGAQTWCTSSRRRSRASTWRTSNLAPSSPTTW